MISNLQIIAIQSIYELQRYDEIRLLEGTNQGRPYLDTTGNPSVGIGFNLRGNPTVRDEVFFRMGINPNDSNLSAAQQAAELGYLNELNTAAGGSYVSSAAVQQAFDPIMARRANNPLFAGISAITSLTTFTMTVPQMQAVFPAAAQDAENKVDAWLAGIPQSDERIALVSLAYNNLIGVNPDGTFKSPSLRQAIIDDNRAEAWYEIRYASNGGVSRITSGEGIANRRIAESNLFNLYDNPGQGVGEAEAKEVVRMYTTHRTAIQAYESEFSTLFAQGGATIQFQLISATTTLIDIYASGTVPFGAGSVAMPTIDGEVLVGKESSDTIDEVGRSIDLSRNDLIFGEVGNDFIQGHGGVGLYEGTAGHDGLSERTAA